MAKTLLSDEIVPCPFRVQTKVPGHTAQCFVLRVGMKVTHHPTWREAVLERDAPRITSSAVAADALRTRR